jgi:hypothetical protein
MIATKETVTVARPSATAAPVQIDGRVEKFGLAPFLIERG